MDSHPKSSNEPKHRIFLWANRIESAILVICLVTMIILAFANILMRNVFGGGIVWADQMLTQLVLWGALLGGAITTRKNNHIRIDVLSYFISGTAKKYTRILTNLFAAIVCGLLAWGSFFLVWTIEYPEHKILIPHMETWMPMAIMPVCFGIMCFRFLSHMAIDSISIYKNSK